MQKECSTIVDHPASTAGDVVSQIDPGLAHQEASVVGNDLRGSRTRQCGNPNGPGGRSSPIVVHLFHDDESSVDTRATVALQ